MNTKIESTKNAGEESERVIDSEAESSELVSYGQASERTRGLGWGPWGDSNGWPRVG